MYKILGVVLIMTGSIGVSCRIIHDMKKEVELKKNLIKMLQLLESEIRHHHLNLPECFAVTAGRLTGQVAAFLMDLSDDLKNKMGTSLSELWQEKVRIHFTSGNDAADGILGECEIVQLCRFGTELGFSDQTIQLNMIRQYEQQLQEDMDRAVMKIRETSRIYRTMGILGGAFLVIMLL
ncbi:MAG: stage III sporulation protein AB [bacterium]|nr:stage III sporulation protein AB [bacterium]